MASAFIFKANVCTYQPPPSCQLTILFSGHGGGDQPANEKNRQSVLSPYNVFSYLLSTAQFFCLREPVVSLQGQVTVCSYSCLVCGSIQAESHLPPSAPLPVLFTANDWMWWGHSSYFCFVNRYTSFEKCLAYCMPLVITYYSFLSGFFSECFLHG